MSSTAVTSHTRNVAHSGGRFGNLSVQDAFIQGNPRIEIISGGGRATPVPPAWRPILRDSDVLVIVPDMHMFLYTSTLDNFKFGARPMLDFLTHAEACKESLSRIDIRMNMYQLGDMFELCFPHPRFGRPVTVRDIRDSHPIYDEIVKRFHQLEFQYIIGNHDAEHRQKRGGITSTTDGAVYMEHGYSADPWFHFTNPDHRHWRSSMKALRVFRRMEAKVHHLGWKMGYWDNVFVSAIGINSGELERRTITDPMEYPRRQVHHYTNVVRKSASPPRVCIISHTHRPYLDPNFAENKCIYVDAGAWTEGRSDFVVLTNSEVAICRYKRIAHSMSKAEHRIAS